MANQGSNLGSIISLPEGGGALHGIGEKFAPDLYTGTGNFTVPIAVPPGRNGFQPQLNLVYSTGNGNGPFGLGWHLTIPGISRKTSQGVPQYEDALSDVADDNSDPEDTFVISGAEDLVPVPRREDDPPNRRRYRPRTEGLFANIERQLDATNDFWEVKTKDGLISSYGSAQDRGNDLAVTPKPGSSNGSIGKVFAWKLTSTRDPFNNLIRYEYLRDAGRVPSTNPAIFEHEWDQPLLGRILYADYGDPANPNFLISVKFHYENRPDPFSDYRAGFEIRTSKRCSKISITSHADTDLQVREYVFVYDNNARNRVSHLKQIEIVGFDDLGTAVVELPPLEFGYTKFEPEDRKFDPVVGDLPSNPLSNNFMEVVDLHGAGLPDLLEMNGSVRYWRNLGGGRFDLPRTMGEAPPHRLGDPGVQLIDANGNGRPDLMICEGPLAGFYPLKFGPQQPSWNSFRSFKSPPSFYLEDPEVRLLDLDGDGITDALRSGSRFECFFNSADPHRGWRTRITRQRRSLSLFPDINFSDPRVRFADMSGDGLDDVVLIYDRNVEYWPNLGYGNWAPRVHMRAGPDLPHDYDPRRLLLGDVDGDGLADIVYVEDGEVRLWINQSGNAWSDPIVVEGTPRMNNLTSIRLVDLKGSGTAGVLWSSDATAGGKPHMFFLDLTGEVKPYLLNVMNNHMGAVTRVEYAPSSQFYLQDLPNPKTRWKTPLPFPVQVVSRVEVIDDISKGKLTTEYKYHHGYWDGAEREFHGFGMVEQFDSETFERYHEQGLHKNTAFKPVEEKHFSEPTLTKTWFHQGAVGDESGDWSELDLTSEYCEVDPPLLQHAVSVNKFLKENIQEPFGSPLSGTRLRLSRRAQRDALRSLRGNILRTELYALDGHREREALPYTITEYSYSLREVDAPADNDTKRRRIFFPHRTAQRTTQWERGADPLTIFTFTDDYDAFGQPRKRTIVALPRRAKTRAHWTVAVNRQVSPDETRILATHTRTNYATPDPGFYLFDRVCRTKSFELTNPPQPANYDVNSLVELLRNQFDDAKSVRAHFVNPADDEALLLAGAHMISHTLNYYDGEAFIGLPYERAGRFGALIRTETLAFRDEELKTAYAEESGSRRPAYLGGAAALPTGAPTGFGSNLGYQQTSADGSHVAGYYANTTRKLFDFQVPTSFEKRGLVLAHLDARGNRRDITPDDYWLLPAIVTDSVGLQTRAAYNYRLLQPSSVTDHNQNVTEFKFSPIGLLTEIWIKGEPAKNEGDRQHPSVKHNYDFLAYHRTRNGPPNQRLPVFVNTSRRVWHDADSNAPPAERDAVIGSREYSDGFGRLIQTRAQAEDWIFGDTGDNVGLPASQDGATGPAIGRKVADRVVVSGWQVYDNKSRTVEKYEPFFDQGWDFQREEGAKRGVFAQLFHDPRGQIVRTVYPDGSEQRVIFGRPADLKKPDAFEPSPWESCMYDSNDLASVSNGTDGNLLSDRSPITHQFTPSTLIVDALGRVIAHLQRNGPDPAKHWFVIRSSFDIRSNLLILNDALGRDAVKYAYDLLDRSLRVESIDAGLGTSVLDAAGNLAEYRDRKGSVSLREYDSLNRLTKVWARNKVNDRLTLREQMIYGDVGDRGLARVQNQLGRLVEHRDEAGTIRFTGYDFTGNTLDKSRLVISDTALANDWQPDWDDPNAMQALDNTVYQTTMTYDALNRTVSVTYPADVNSHRAVLRPGYNRAGALERVVLDDVVYVERIAYNARGQRIFTAFGNSIVTRYAYDPQTFRLSRQRTEHITSPALPARTAAFLAGVPGSQVTISFGGALLQDLEYRYDLIGNVKAIDERVPNCGINGATLGRNRLLRSFEYDPLYRLTRADGRECRNIGVPRVFEDLLRCGFYAGGSPTTNQDNAPDLTELYTENYSYDPAGNMLEMTHQAGANAWKRTFSMGGLLSDQWAAAPNNRLTRVVNESDTHHYQFDLNGNLIQQGSEKQHTWDHADRMISYRVQTDSASPPSLEARYLYAPDGMRVKKWVRNQQNTIDSTTYVNGIFEHHRHSDNAGTRENNTLQVKDNQSCISLVRIGQPFDTRDASPPVQYHLGDHLGNSTIVLGGRTAEEQTFINREEYFPYGETSFGSFGKKRYRFAGKESDEENGLYYFGKRYYGPWLGRWISPDPAGTVDGANLFRPFRNNPIVFRDVIGEASERERTWEERDRARDADLNEREWKARRAAEEAQRAQEDLEALEDFDPQNQGIAEARRKAANLREVAQRRQLELDLRKRAIAEQREQDIAPNKEEVEGGVTTEEELREDPQAFEANVPAEQPEPAPDAPDAGDDQGEAGALSIGPWRVIRMLVKETRKDSPMVTGAAPEVPTDPHGHPMDIGIEGAADLLEWSLGKLGIPIRNKAGKIINMEQPAASVPQTVGWGESEAPEEAPAQQHHQRAFVPLS